MPGFDRLQNAPGHLGGLQRIAHKISIGLSLVAVTWLLSSLPAFALSPLLKKLDDHYYFPQHQGLKRLSFTIHWAQMDPFSDSKEKSFLTNPTVNFQWKAGDALPQFQLEENQKDVSPFRELEITKLISQYHEAFLPVPLAKKLEDYAFKGRKKQRQLIEARFATRTPNAVLQYDFIVDPRRWVINTLHMKRSSSPVAVTSQLRYVERDGKWQVSESRAQFRMNGKDFEEVTRFTYEQIDGYWLPTRLHQEIREGAKLARSYIFTLGNHRVN